MSSEIPLATEKGFLREDDPSPDVNLIPSTAEQDRKRQEIQAAEEADRKKEADKLEDLDLALTPIEQLIDEANVSPEQKKQWKEMAKLDVPKDARIKVIAVIGGQGLDTSEEASSIKSAFRGAYKNVDFVFISNNQPRNIVMSQISAQMHISGYDVIMPYFSAHGGTRSLAGEVPQGVTNDTFVVLNGQESILDEYSAQANSEAKRIIAENVALFIDPATNQFKQLPDGTQIAFNGGTIHISNGLDFNAALKEAQAKGGSLESVIENVVANLIFNKLVFDSNSDVGITSDEMLAMQEGSESDFIYFFDNCHAGSATDDALANGKNTMAILSASATEEVALQGNAGRGVFMEKVFSYMQMNCTFGESFVRSDMELNMKGDQSQDPKASLRTESGVLQVGSISGRAAA